MSAHLSWETLNDFVDGRLASTARAQAEAHASSCAECTSRERALRELLARATHAPRAVDAPPAAWNAIRHRIETQKVAALPGAVAPARKTSVAWLAAAAAVLIVASSATTMLFMQGRTTDHLVVVVDTTGRGAATSAAGLPVDVVNVERRYLSTVDELAAALNDPRSKLSPETVRSITRSLKAIDGAIDEARKALIADPASGLLKDILAKNYERKVDLLRRATTRVVAS